MNFYKIKGIKCKQTNEIIMYGDLIEVIVNKSVGKGCYITIGRLLKMEYDKNTGVYGLKLDASEKYSRRHPFIAEDTIVKIQKIDE
jgi:hypothetical protein